MSSELSPASSRTSREITHVPGAAVVWHRSKRSAPDGLAELSALIPSTAVTNGAGPPAACTCFGQMIAHDLTDMRFGTAPGGRRNTRGHPMKPDTILLPAADCGPAG